MVGIAYPTSSGVKAKAFKIMFLGCVIGRHGIDYTASSVKALPKTLS
jgi:hypothetical protein